MTKEQTFLPKRSFCLSIRTEREVPFTIEINSTKLITAVFLIAIAFLFTLSGLFLFFREVELNRKLIDRILALKISERLAKPTNFNVSTAPPAPEVVQKSVEAVMAPSTVTPEVSAPIQSASARLADSSLNCTEEACTAQISLSPSKSGLVEGELLLVLETQVPRIGSSANLDSAQVRMKYFIYPGYLAKDEFNDEILTSLQRKPFRFSKALQTTTTFTMGKLLRPVAVNIYLYDSQKNLIQHERRSVDEEASVDP